MLELKDATLTIDGQTLFKRLSLMAQDGQMTCITGPSGCGKTAMIRAMMGFIPLDEGLVSVDGELLTALSAPTFRRLMGYMPQKRKTSMAQITTDTEGLETVWAPQVLRDYQPTPIDERLDVAPMASKPIVIADDPDSTQLSLLRSLAVAGHTVIVATKREEYLNLSEKTITLEKT